MYVQLGTEWIQKCVTDRFCYKKCKKDAVEDEIHCSQGMVYGNICYCDLKCIVYGDCCPDVFLHCWNMTDLDTINSFINTTRNTMLLNENPDDLVARLSLDLDSSENILVGVYAQFGICRQVTFGTREKFIYAVGRCPPNAENSLKFKCEMNVSPLLPPVYAHVGVVDVEFSNVYCAMCHGVKEEHLTPFTTQIACPSILDSNSTEEISMSGLIEFIESGVCNVTFEDTSRPCCLRPCQEEYMLTLGDLQQLISSVQADQCTETDVVLCSSYLYPFEGFKNPHCRKCLSSNTTLRDTKSTQSYTIYHDSCLDGICRSEKVNGGIYLFLDVTGTYVDRNGAMKTKYPCQDEEVLDFMTHECKHLVCPRGQKAFRGQCQGHESEYLENKLRVGSSHTWTTLQMVVWPLTASVSCLSFSLEYVSNAVPDLLIKEIVIKHSGDEIGNTTSEGTPGYTKNNNMCTDIWEGGASDKTNTTPMEVRIVLKHALDLATLKQIKHLPRLITGVQFEANITSSFEGLQFMKLCQNVTKYTPANLTQHTERVYVMINSTKDNEASYLLQSLEYKVRISSINKEYIITETVLFCEQSSFFSNEECRVVTYSLNETTLNSSGLYVIKSGQLYEVNDFEISDDMVYVCSKFLFPTIFTEFGEGIITLVLNLVFSSISIMFLLSMVIIYCVFPSLQTLAGKMTASLASTMGLVFIANILSFVETRNQYVCPIVAVVSHLALLSQFGWMSAIAVNMAVTFGPSSLNNVILWNGSSHFWRYNIIVYCGSLTLVLVAGILDLLHDDHQMSTTPCSNKSSNTNSSESVQMFNCQNVTETFDYPRYGYPVCSWFSGPLWARLAFVVVPFAFSYIINITCFIVTLVGIHKSSKVTKTLGRSSSDRVQCVIYIKLSTAMGFTWLLSLLGNVLQETEVIAYLFTVLILLQGVCLFLAFMANKRVVTLICDRCLNAGRSEQSNSGATSKRRLYTSSTG